MATTTDTTEARVRLILDRLDVRAEAGTFLPGADRVAWVMGTYHDDAGSLERQLPVLSEREMARSLWTLRGILSRHVERCAGACAYDRVGR